MNVKSPKRSQAQNNALHLFFEQLADELNARGLDLTSVITIKSPWTKERVKYVLWYEAMVNTLGKVSTTEMTTAEVDKVLAVIETALVEIGVYDLKFPSINTLTENYDKTR